MDGSVAVAEARGADLGDSPKSEDGTSVAVDGGDTVLGSLYFLARDAKYEHEKPYTLRYAPAPETGLAQTNIARVAHAVAFRDLRSCFRDGGGNLSYEACGFQMVCMGDAPTATPAADALPSPSPESYDSTFVETVHAPRVLEAVRQALGAESTELIDYVVRRRHAAWPVSTGEPYAFQQPASRAHIDHTYAGAVAVIREAHGAEAAETVLARRWQLVNAWHPLQGPLVDWPLAMCDARTVDFAHDTMAGDVVDRHQVFENTQVHYNAQQQWYYLRNQMPEELLVFKNADSNEPQGASPGVPHASFDNPLRTEADFRRESLEMRILVVW